MAKKAVAHLQILSLIFSLTLCAFSSLLKSVFAAAPDIVIMRAGSKKIPLEPEDTSAISARPLAKTRDRLNAKFKREIIFLYKIKAPEGSSLVGRYKLEDGPLRITVYEITKKPDSARQLRVVRTRFCQKGEMVEFRTVTKKFDEQVYLVTAEAAISETELNPHLRYMNAQDNEITLAGFSTNWNLSTLRLHLLGKEEAEKNEVEFTKDADLLVSHLINPQWIVSIRVESL